MKTAFVSGLGTGLGIGAVFLVSRVVSDFLRGLFGIDDGPSGDDE